MHVIIIPGFTGYPEEITFQELSQTLLSKGHSVTKIAWPHIPDDLEKYSISETLSYSRQVLSEIDTKEMVLLGFSMGGIIASFLAKEFKPMKLGLVVTPYQAGSKEHLDGKYKQWRIDGYRKLTSSKYGDLTIPYTFIEDALQYNALEVIAQIDCPKLFIAAGADEKVSMQSTKKFFEKAGEQKELKIIENMQHKYQYQDGMLEKVNRELVEFIEQPL